MVFTDVSWQVSAEVSRQRICEAACLEGWSSEVNVQNVFVAFSVKISDLKDSNFTYEFDACTFASDIDYFIVDKSRSWFSPLLTLICTLWPGSPWNIIKYSLSFPYGWIAWQVGPGLASDSLKVKSIQLENEHVQYQLKDTFEYF